MQKTLDKLTIGFVLDDSLDRNDGVQQYVLLLGSWLSKRGHDVHYITSTTTRNDLVNLHSIGKQLRVNFNKNKVGTPLPVAKVAIHKLFANDSYDVLHVQTPHSPLFAHRIIKSAPNNTAVVGTFHIMPFSTVERLMIRALGVALRQSIKRSNTIIAVSAPAAMLCRWAFRLPSVPVIPNAVDMTRFAPSSRASLSSTNKNVTMVYLGRLVPRKGCMELLKAINLLVHTYKRTDFTLQICGKGEQLHRLQEYVKTNNISEYVNFVGFVSEEDKVKRLQAADIAVFPSLGGESFGIVLLEAMAAGTETVIAGNNPGYSSVMKGLDDQLIDPQNTPKFADLLQKYITDATVRQQTKRKQLELVKSFDISVVGSSIEQEYYKAIAKQRRKIDNKS